MHFKIQLVIDDEQSEIKTEDIIHFKRVGKQASLVGLSLMESKDLTEKNRYMPGKGFLRRTKTLFLLLA